MPLKVGRREMLVSVRVVADRADLVGDEASISLRHLVIRNNRIVRFAKVLFVNKSEVAHIEKAFDLSPRSGLDVRTVQRHLKTVRVVPLHQFRQILRSIVDQTYPDKTVFS